MKERRAGRIVCTASAIAYKGARGFAHYASSKAAVLGFVRALARELAPSGITVNSISPGTANTAMPRQHRTEDELHERGAKVPLGRIAEPDDIVNAVVFLASDAAGYITGQSILLTGGDLMV
jgi:3-oxoacyl-[acyl-carrier protein] reductase